MLRLKASCALPCLAGWYRDSPQGEERVHSNLYSLTQTFLENHLSLDLLCMSPIHLCKEHQTGLSALES